MVETVSPDTVPSVIAYRVGQLEKAVTLGFEKHNTKLDSMINNFASKSDVTSLLAVLQEHSTELKGLVITDATQQGSIDATRRFTTVGITILGIALSALAVYFGVHK